MPSRSLGDRPALPPHAPVKLGGVRISTSQHPRRTHLKLQQHKPDPLSHQLFLLLAKLYTYYAAFLPNL